jgi:hypothetical protein
MNQGKIRPREDRIHAAYPRLDERHQIPIASKALPVCYAHEYLDERVTFEPKTYDLSLVTCAKCRKVAGKYKQLPAVLELAKGLEKTIS